MDEHHAALLSAVGPFGLLPREKLERFAQVVPFKGFGVGQHVFTPAYRGEVFFLLLEGRVRIYRLEAGTLGLIGRHIVVEDTEPLQRIAEDVG